MYSIEGGILLVVGGVGRWNLCLICISFFSIGSEVSVDFFKISV